MRRFTQIFLIIALWVIPLFYVSAQTSVSLNTEQKKKIDGRFGYLLNREYLGLNLPEALLLIPDLRWKIMLHIMTSSYIRTI